LGTRFFLQVLFVGVSLLSGLRGKTPSSLGLIDVPQAMRMFYFEFLRDEKTDYFEIDLELSGTDLPLSESEHSNRARAVLGLETLKFENGKYMQVSRERGNPPRHVAQKSWL